MNDLIIEFYEPLSYCAYLGLFIINTCCIISYFRNNDAEGRMLNERLCLLDLGYIIYGIVFVYIERYFSFFCQKTNIDESFHLGLALKYINGDRFWIDIDPSSVGPLNTLLFSFVSLFTNEVSYYTAKLTTMIVICISFLLLFIIFKTVAKRVVTYLITTCFIIHFSIPDGPTSLSYNSELILLILLPLWLLAHLNSRRYCSKFWICLEFFVIGLLPFGKLQFGPTALFLFLFSTITYFKDIKYSSFSLALRSLVLPLSFCALPLVIVLINAYWNNAILWFFRFYFINMISYLNTDHLDDISTSVVMYQNFNEYWGNIFYLSSLTLFDLFLIVCCVLRKKYRVALFCLIFIFISIYEVLRPLFSFVHYTNIMVIPLFVSAVLLLSKLNSKGLNTTCILFSMFFMGNYFINFDDDFQLKSFYANNSGILPQWFDIAKDLKMMSNESDRLVVWGWMDELYVLSGLPSGTAEIAIGGFVPNEIVNRVYPRFTKEKYIYDIINNKPRFIIDTPSPISMIYNSYDYSLKNDHEMWNVVKRYYHLKKEYVFSMDGVGCSIPNNTCVKIPLYEIN